MIRFCLAAVLMALPLRAAASGKIFADLYVPTANKFTRPLTAASLSWWHDLDHKFGGGESPWAARGLLDFALYEGNNSAVTGEYERTHLDIALREGYFSYTSGGFEGRIGNQIIPWGKSDVINPTDYLSARDFRRFTPDSEVQRRPSSGVWLSWTPESLQAWNFTAVGNHATGRGYFLIAPSLLPPGVTYEATPYIDSGFLNRGEVAVKASYTGERWDFSLSGYDGYNHYPELQEASRLIISPVDVRLTLKDVFRKRSAAGADFSWSGETWVYRFEGAHVWTENRDGANMMSVPSYLQAVVGAERPFWDDFRLQVQYAHKYHTAYRPIDEMTGASPVDGMIERQIAGANATLFQYQERDQGTVTVRVSYANESSGWDAEVFFMENLRGQDFLVRPKASYAWSDSLRYTFGADLYGGPGHRTLGALNAFNSYFLEAKYSY